MISEETKVRFGVTEVQEQRSNLTWISLPPEQVVPMITYLRDQEGFSHFVLLTAVDWIEQGVFQLTYILNNPDQKVDLGLRTQIHREKASMESAHHLWEQVATY